MGYFCVNDVNEDVIKAGVCQQNHPDFYWSVCLLDKSNTTYQFETSLTHMKLLYMQQTALQEVKL